jgi:hypothetical protein
MIKIPFWLSHQRAAVVFVFENTKDIGVWGLEDGPIDFNESAKKFIEQMDGVWCVSLLESLHDEIEKEVSRHWLEFAPSRLKEEPYKSWYRKWSKEIERKGKELK